MAKQHETDTPSATQVSAMQAAFDHLNKHLFGGKLPAPMLTFSRRAVNCLGYYSPEAWSDGEAIKVAEISINANAFSVVDTWRLFGTLAHEMLHHAQGTLPDTYGKMGREGYHTKEFVTLAEQLGFRVEGKGQNVSTDPVGGKILQALRTMPENAILMWEACTVFDDEEGQPGEQPAPAPAPQSRRGKRQVYVCPGCGNRVWGKSGLAISCNCATGPHQFIQGDVQDVPENPEED